MTTPMPFFTVAENDTGPRKTEVSGGGNEVKFALYDRSNVKLKKVTSRSATPKKAFGLNRMTLPVRAEKQAVKQNKSVNLSDMDDDENEIGKIDSKEVGRNVGGRLQPVEGSSEVENVVDAALEEDQGFDENQMPAPEEFNLMPDSDYYYYSTVPSPSDEMFLRMIRKEADCVDVDEQGFPIACPLNDDSPYSTGRMSPADSVDISFGWSDEDVDARCSSGMWDQAFGDFM